MTSEINIAQAPLGFQQANNNLLIVLNPSKAGRNLFLKSSIDKLQK
jgi:hypothetical protein